MPSIFHLVYICRGLSKEPHLIRLPPIACTVVALCDGPPSLLPDRVYKLSLKSVIYRILGMTKVHPNAAATASETPKTSAPDGNAAVVLTVWKKSLLFNCNGFTVFDGKGNLVFRVDNYVAGNRGEIVLMDAAGKPLLTIRRKRLSLGDNWLVFDGDTAVNPRFSARKHVNLLNSKCLAHVSSGTNYNGVTNSGSGSGSGSSPNKNAMYEIEGSYAQRCCAMYDDNRRCLAEIKRKEAVGGVDFGVEVFRLIVQPEIETAVAMALVILLDQMYGSSRRFSP